MSTAVKGIEKAESIDRRKRAKDRVWGKHGYESGREDQLQEDSVMISEEARNRASGRHRKTIVEHLAEKEDERG